MQRPPTDPIGLQLIGVAQSLSDALDDALTLEGGSLSTWRVLVSGKDQHPGAHPEGNEVGGVGGTWSDELSRLESAGLIVRSSDPQNAGVPGVELTEAGEALFHRLLRAVVAFDRRLRAGLTDQEVAAVSSTLARLRGNLAGLPT